MIVEKSTYKVRKISSAIGIFSQKTVFYIRLKAMKLAYKRRIFYELIGSYNGLMLIHIIHVLNFKKLNSMQRTGILQMVKFNIY